MLDDDSDTESSLIRMLKDYVRGRVIYMTDWLLRSVGIRRGSDHLIDVNTEIDRLRVRDWMIHRRDLVCLDVGEDICFDSSIVLEDNYCFVTTEGSRDHIIGLLDREKLRLDISCGKDRLVIEDYVMNVTRMLDGCNVRDVIRQMVDDDIEVVLLMDEYGGTSGLFTRDIALKLLYETLL